MSQLKPRMARDDTSASERISRAYLGGLKYVCRRSGKLAGGGVFLARIIAKGLVVVEGNEHREQRKNVAPAFSGRAIKDLVPLFWNKGLSLVEAAKCEAGVRDGTIDIMELTSRATLDAVGSAGLGNGLLQS
ncbi:hypothetical protein LTR22_026668 [Elasticomyces elasticus]|nr:hypothetical protein LTR22_026668 [Elasticomyces elasticus]